MEKEAYFIFYAFQKSEHLIRDKHSTLGTDSRKLTFLNVDYRKKVKQSKPTIQDKDFDIIHIKGVNKQTLSPN